MKEFDLINHSQFEYELTCLNNEFEQFQIKEFDRDSCLIPITNWIEKFLIFIREIQDGYTFIQRNNELERFIDAVAEKYPYYNNPSVFDPKSNFTNSEFQLWENSIIYLNEFNKQNTKLKEIGEGLLFDFYLNKIKEFEPLSNELHNSLRLKKQISGKSVITEDVLDQFSQIIKTTPSKIISHHNPHIFVNEEAFDLYIDLCNVFKLDRNKLIIEDIVFIINQLKHQRINAIYKETSLTSLCTFVNEHELTKGLNLQKEHFKNRNSVNRQNKFDVEIKKYKIPFSKNP